MSHSPCGLRRKPRNGKVTALLLYFCVWVACKSPPLPTSPSIPQHFFIFHCVPSLCSVSNGFISVQTRKHSRRWSHIQDFPHLICLLERRIYNNNLLNVCFRHFHIKEKPQLWRSLIFEKLNPAAPFELLFVDSFQALECALEQWSDCSLWCQQDVSHVWGRACEPLFCFYAREWASVSSITLFQYSQSWWFVL